MDNLITGLLICGGVTGTAIVLVALFLVVIGSEVIKPGTGE